MYSYFPPFNIFLFVGFEVLTIFAEFGILALIAWATQKEGIIRKLDRGDYFLLLCLTVLVNLFSAIIALPVWIELGVGV